MWVPAKQIITPAFAKMVYKHFNIYFASSTGVAVAEKFKLELPPTTIVQKFADPEFVQSYQQLTQAHPRGTHQRNNRLSGNFFDLVQSCGTYLGLGPVQSQKNTAHLAPKTGPFGVDAEMTHYTNVKNQDTNESAQEYGARVHGIRLMANGRINPLTGAGGRYLISATVTNSIWLLNLDFDDPMFQGFIDLVGKHEDIATLLPAGVFLSDLFRGNEALHNRLLHQAFAAAIFSAMTLLKIDGVIMRSTRGDAQNKMESASIICVWSDDGAKLDSLRVYNLSYFDFAEKLPRLVTTPVDGNTDFQRLRDLALTANQ